MVSSRSQNLPRTNDGGDVINVDATARDRTLVDISKGLTEERPLSTMILDCPAAYMRRLIVLPEQKLLVAVSDLSDVYVFDMDSSGKARTVFKEHSRQVNDVAKLEGDLVVSVGTDRMLYSWRAASAELVGKWEHGKWLSCVTRVDEHTVITGDCHGKIMVFRHESGTSFRVLQRIESSFRYWYGLNMVLDHNLIVFCPEGEHQTAQLWDAASFTPLAILHHEDDVWAIAMNDKYIVTVDEGNIYVYQNTNGYPLDFVLSLGSSVQLFAVSLIHDDTIIVGGSQGRLYFISLPAKTVLSYTKCDADYIWSIAVLSDGRLALGNMKKNNGSCTVIRPPESVRELVANFAASLYPQSLLPRRSTTGPATTRKRAIETAEVGEDQLQMWKNIGVSKDAVEALGSEELAGCVAAYLVNYETKLTHMFREFKEKLTGYFVEGCIFGETLTLAEEEDKRELPDIILYGLTKCSEPLLKARRMRMKQFVRLSASS